MNDSDNIVKLSEKRRQLREATNPLLRRHNLSLEQRVAELEMDLLRAVEQIIDLTQRLEDQERYFRLLLKALKEE